MLEKLEHWWSSLGMIGPCSLLGLGGSLLMAGSIANWRWLYPDHPSVRGCSDFFKRILLFFIGLTLIATAIVFYIFREHFHTGG